MPQAWQFLTSPQKTRWQALRAASEKAARMGGNFRNCADLVSHVDITWNSFLPYLIQLTNKLEALGFRYVDNKVIILQEKADEK